VTSRRIILDANILVRAVLGARVADIIQRHGDAATFFAPELAFVEAARHLPTIVGKRGFDPAPLLDSLGQLREVVDVVPSDVTEPLKEASLIRIGARDPMDWPIVAAALALGCPIWTEDKDFFGSGIATWTSDRVEIYLGGS